MASAKLRCTSVILLPVDPVNLENNSVYIDQGTQAVSTKGSSGTTTAVGPTGAGTNPALKVMQNLTGFPIPGGTPVAKLPTGGIAPADAAVIADQVVIGVTVSLIANNGTGAVTMLGPNVPGAVAGLGFAPGDPVYLAAGGGYTNNPSTISTTSGDAVIRLGYADCAAGTASSTAVDLILFAEAEGSVQ